MQKSSELSKMLIIISDGKLWNICSKNIQIDMLGLILTLKKDNKSKKANK